MLTSASNCSLSSHLIPAEGWKSRWVHSDWKKSEGQAGEFKLTAGPFYGDAEADKGIATSENARFYAISSKFAKPFSSYVSRFVTF